MEKENIYIDLSKCSEEQRKEIARTINKHGHSITSKANYEIINGYYDELFPLLTYHEYWYCSRYASGKTELTYPEFIKLFEGGEGENETYSFSYLSCGKTLTVHIEAKNFNKAMIEFATNYHDIEWLYHAKIL